MFYPYFPEGWLAFKLFADESEQPHLASVAHIAGNVYIDQYNSSTTNTYIIAKRNMNFCIRNMPLPPG